MRPPPFQARARAGLLAAAVLLLAGNLRTAITSVGPLVGEIRGDTGISHGLAGLITTLPLLAFAAMSSLAPRLGRRFGIERTLLASLVVLTVGILVRSSGPVAALFGGTALLGLAIAAGNVLLPALVKRDFPDRAGWMTGLYSGAMGVMATVAVALAVPVADRAGLGWRGSLACWATPAAVAALVWLPLARRPTRPGSPDPSAAPGASQAHTRLWRSGLAWQVTAFMGLQSLVFYSTIAWLAEILGDRGVSASAAGWLVSVAQLAGLVTSLALPPLAATGPAALGLVHDLTGAWTVPLAALAAVTVLILLAGLAAGRDALVAAPGTPTAAPVTPAAGAGPARRGG